MDWRDTMSGARMQSVTVDATPMIIRTGVTRVHMYDVPNTLAAYAHRMLMAMCGPLTTEWWSIGEYTLDGVRVALVARVEGRHVAYGTAPTLCGSVPDTVADEDMGRVLPRTVGCTDCMDVRPNRDTIGQGAIVGEDCVFPDCHGVYA